MMNYNIINTTQVQLTNDASTTSKYSSVAKNYFQDNFIHYFVEKKKPRASLINLGYYVRATILFKLLQSYIKFLKTKNMFKFQIVSCGAGFDTSYWRLMEAQLLSSDSLFIEIDFSNIIKRKLKLISQMDESGSFMSSKQVHKNVHLINKNYYLMEGDLEDLKSLENLFNFIKVDFSIPTLFLSECVITYMKKNSSNNLIKWMAENFENSAFINYEQIHPDDGFGQVMMNHFEKIQSPLYSVISYPDCSSHCARYFDLGFETSFAVSEWDAFISLTTPLERQTSFGRELFDEFEEFHNKCVHYVVGVSGNQTASLWIKTLSFVSLNPLKCERNIVHLHQLFPIDVNLYRHCSLSLNNQNVYLIGGCNKQKRSTSIFKIDFKSNTRLEAVNVIGNKDIQLDVVFGTVAHFELKGDQYCCIYGGRTSPDLGCNPGALMIFQISNKDWTLKHVVNDINLISRYRTSMTSLMICKNEVDIWIFGGRSAVLGETLPDLLKIRIILDDKGIFNHKIETYKKDYENWPSSRMSHSTTACQRTSSLFISCGLTTDSFDVLNDLWKWDCNIKSWTKLELNGKMLPRYGHASHIIESKLYFVGGVNTLAGLQPGLAILNLENLNVMEFAIEQVSGSPPFLLFNHSTEIIENNGKLILLILGGGGNCFSFGTYLNRGIYYLSLDYEF